MYQFLSKIPEFLLKIVKLKPLQQAVLLLIITVGLLLFILYKGGDNKDNVQSKLDNCQQDKQNQARQFYEKIDSMRLEQIQQKETTNREKEIALKNAQETTRILEKTLEKLRNGKK